MTQKEFLDYIYQRHSGNVKLGLERMLSILAAMDNPNEKLKGIHIAGTNGKGSTAAICEALGMAHGLQTGLNTSPHLIDYNERIRVNGSPVDYNEIMITYKQWETVFEKYEASFFEISTALAFYLFHRKLLNLSIFEVGLGGRLDGTNPFQSNVTVITSISYDHPKSLGESLEEIAFEKAGILKPSVPLVLGSLPQAALSKVLQQAVSKKCPSYQLGKDFFCENIRFEAKGTSFDFHTSEYDFPNLTVNLLGRHQANNAAIALKSFELFMSSVGKKMEADKVYDALQRVNWLGRMQILQKEPTVIIDGAHNQEGIELLVENLKILYPNQKVIFVIAILRDKKIDFIMQKLCSISKKMYISKNQSARAAEIEEQLTIAKRYSKSCVAVENVINAVRQAVSEANKNDIVVVCGSLYTIAEVLQKSN